MWLGELILAAEQCSGEGRTSFSPTSVFFAVRPVRFEDTTRLSDSTNDDVLAGAESLDPVDRSRMT